MLKGINKQIIEIKCPESEHFEKILLFMKCENGYVPVKHLGSEIYEYYTNLMNEGGTTPVKKRIGKQKTVKLLIVSGIILSGLIGLLSVSLIL